MDLGKMKRLLTLLERTQTRALISAVFLLALASGCDGTETAGQGSPSATTLRTSPVTSAPAQTSPIQGQPQPKLPVLKLWVGTNQVAAEIARTLPQIQTGMMFRTNMAEMEGMLFVFPQPQEVRFYMRNTLVPLTCAYIDPEGNILEIYDMEPLNEATIPSRSDQIQYVLEMKQGWFERHDIRPGMAISTERGTFPKTFQRQ